MFTACVLGCLDYHPLLHACISSLQPGLQTGLLSAIRVGLNSPSAALLRCVAEFCRDGVIADNNVYVAPNNLLKYPMMRAMFNDAANPIVSPFIMWCDDDSQVPHDAAWWRRVADVCANADYVGQRWRMRLSPLQRLWQQAQPWCKTRPPAMQEFMQGAWWCLRTERMREADWPHPCLRHNGGDVLLGAMARQAGWRQVVWSDGVMVNAGFTGKQSGAQRRQHTSTVPIGADYRPGQPYVTVPLPELVKFERTACLS